MKKTYCDVCGEECEELDRDDEIRIVFPSPEGEGEVNVLTLEDVCWDCRDDIAAAVAKILDEGKQARSGR